MPVVYINCERIRDWESFHDVFAMEMGFPGFYGRNMDAWIDCMTSLDTPEDGLTSVHCGPGDVVTLVLDRADLLSPELYGAINECASFVNWRRLEIGERPVLALAAWRAHHVPASAAMIAEMTGPQRTIAVAAGANLGDAVASLHAAFVALTKSAMIAGARLSPLYRTAPVRVGADAPDPGGEYVNAAIVAQSSASPEALLALLHEIELRGGRDRDKGSPHGAPRAIDLDLLVAGDVVLSTPKLTLPHPRMHERAFVLAPLADIAPALVVPGSGGGQTVAQMLARLGPLDPNAVRRIGP